MKEVRSPSNLRSLPTILGLITASLLCLCGGALLAAGHEGLLRLVFGAGSFAGYVFFFAHALKMLGPSSTVSGDAPDGESRGKPEPRKAGQTADRNRALFAAALVVALASALLERPAVAQEQAPQATPSPSPTPTAAPPAPGLQIHGLVDVYASWNPNRPFDHTNFEPGTGTTAAKANELGLNLAALDVSLDPKPVGFHVIAVAGTGTDVVHAAELHPNDVRHIYQASVSYNLNVGRGVVLEAGIQPSHIGYEVFFSKDSPNYTRGWMGEFSPYYSTGLKIATSFDDHWSGQLWLLNGWQNIEDNNSGKAFGTQVAYAKDALGFSVNTFFGPELPDDSSHWRSFVDVVGTWKISEKVNIAASVDLGRQTRPQADAASWQGASLWLRYLLSNPSSSSPSSALALRAECFHDPDNGITGFAQTLWEGTLTFEYRPHPQLILKLEARYDHSTADAFKGPSEDDPRHDQKLLILGAVATF